jgi:uncharacterized protein
VVYVDTSALVALFVPEPHSAGVAKWYAGTDARLVSSAWCVTEFASAMAMKQRQRQLTADQAQLAWQHFERLVANDLHLLPVEAAMFHRAAMMALDIDTTLRAGDALHLACAEAAGAKQVATLDAVMARQAQRMKIKPVVFA